MQALKVAGLLVTLYALCLIASVGSVGATLAISEGWGAGRTSDALMTMLGALAALYLLSALSAFLLHIWMRLGILWNLLATGAYVAALAATFFLFAFLSAVIFNR